MDPVDKTIQSPPQSKNVYLKGLPLIILLCWIVWKKIRNCALSTLYYCKGMYLRTVLKYS